MAPFDSSVFHANSDGLNQEQHGSNLRPTHSCSDRVKRTTREDRGLSHLAEGSAHFEAGPDENDKCKANNLSV